MGRRMEYREIQTTSASGGNTPTTTINTHHRFVYDNCLCIQRLDAANGNAVDLAFVWDVTEAVATRPLVLLSETVPSYYTHDGNKNVIELMSSFNMLITAHYEYEISGKVKYCSGLYSSLNPYKFSSEYDDSSLYLTYYNYRHYDSIYGRWFIRDIAEEYASNNLFRFGANSYLLAIDWLGLKDCCICGTCEIKIENFDEIKVKGLRMVNYVGKKMKIYEEKTFVGESIDVAIDTIGGEIKKKAEAKADDIMTIISLINTGGNMFQPQVKVGRNVKFQIRKCGKEHWFWGDCIWKKWDKKERVFDTGWVGPNENQGTHAMTNQDIFGWAAILYQPDIHEVIKKIEALMHSAFDEARSESVLSKEEILKKMKGTGCTLQETETRDE
jgi:RHS repeat-associated protein